MGIRGSVLSILTQFLSNRSQHVWKMAVGVNWLTLFQECRRAVILASYCSSMKLNVNKTKTMIVSGSRTKHPQLPQLTIVGTVLMESDNLIIL